ncbi:MAG TPA: TolC family protein [Candidatus Saccharimonadales bacterium]|nr:TolC family protein [Candidatus Saccharimonadales bacterium]
MSITKKSAILTLFALLFSHSPVRAQQSPMDISQEHMHHANIQPVAPIYPRLGRAQENAQGRLFTLDDAQRLAAQANPTLRQAEAEIRAATARRQQSSLYPNPTLGYTGDEIRGGANNGGKQGFFLQQNIVTGGKLGKSAAVFSQESRLAEIEAEEQKLRVETAVRSAFYRVLAAQELLFARQDLAQIERNYAQSQRELFNTGQADESEVLEAEVDAQRQRLSARMQENTLREEWKSLAAVVGQPDLPASTVAADLTHGWPDINEDQIIEIISAHSPATRIADSAASRASAEIVRAKSQAIPDLQLRGGLQYNNEPISPNVTTGWEGLAEVAIEIPIFNRNQGNIAAASADLDRAQLEKQRVALALRERAATILDEYASAKLMALEYRDEILPRSQKAYTLLHEKYGLMLASYPHVLQAQRKLFQLQTEYIAALENIWTTGIALQGFLLTDGLEAPSRPGEIDRPIRETNLPMPERNAAFDPMPRP